MIAKELRILMLEDLEDDAGLMDRVLLKDKLAFTRIRVDTREEFIDALDTFNPDLILSDHALPQFNSIEALSIVQGSKSDIPFIIVTGSVSEEFAVNCIKMGVDDYVLKTNLARLPIAIKHTLREHYHKRVQKQQDETLQKQNSELLKVNKELDSFVYNISHNLRSPLASVIGLVNVAQMEQHQSKETVDRYFDMIKKSTLRLDHTLKEILDFSENLRSELKFTEIDLRQLCRESYARVKVESNAIVPQFNFVGHVPFYSDRDRLSIVLSYLFSNSFNFRDARKDNSFVRVNASVSPTQAVISVLDNGVGIAVDQLPHVFDMFVRTHESSDGAGLGLYIVKEVVEKLSGTIGIDSVLGEWTRVDITIPNADVPTAA
ncbi:MAG TPA: hybrid sensor histidine kinase/response regulator [Cyclobacteriaceae bacterium]|nr:hybrid sensor histidine kinase/response regulator [Cyclobacteriaceae bacterium]